MGGLPFHLCCQDMRATASFLSAQQVSTCLTPLYWVSCQPV
jgi:hypothetical protein